jgi:hypothetical protein
LLHRKTDEAPQNDLAIWRDVFAAAINRCRVVGAEERRRELARIVSTLSVY